MAFRLTSFRVALAALALVSVAACSDDKKDAAPVDTTGASWSVDGTNVTANSQAVVTSSADLSTTLATGSATDYSSVNLTFPRSTGTFALGSTGAMAVASYTLDNTSYRATTGNITVTTLTPSTVMGESVVIGTFNFTGTNTNGVGSKTVANGKFNLKY